MLIRFFSAALAAVIVTMPGVARATPVLSVPAILTLLLADDRPTFALPPVRRTPAPRFDLRRPVSLAVALGDEPRWIGPGDDLPGERVTAILDRLTESSMLPSRPPARRRSALDTMLVLRVDANTGKPGVSLGGGIAAAVWQITTVERSRLGL